MARKGIKNRRTLIREARVRQAAQEAAGAARSTEGTILLDSMAVMEIGMRYFMDQFYIERGKKKPNPDKASANLKDATAIARDINPYRYARLAVMRLATDPNKPRLDQVSKEELRRQIILEAHELGLFDARDQLALTVDDDDEDEPPSGVANREVE